VINNVNRGDHLFVSERFQYPKDREIYSAAKVKALESLLVEKGIITSDTVDKVLHYFEKEMGPFNGAKLVAKAWVDTEYKARLLDRTPFSS
jgi:nitrile hydratase